MTNLRWTKCPDCGQTVQRLIRSPKLMFEPGTATANFTVTYEIVKTNPEGVPGWGSPVPPRLRETRETIKQYLLHTCPKEVESSGEK